MRLRDLYNRMNELGMVWTLSFLDYLHKNVIDEKDAKVVEMLADLEMGKEQWAEKLEKEISGNWLLMPGILAKTSRIKNDGETIRFYNSNNRQFLKLKYA